MFKMVAMLKELTIQNIILIDHAQIHFERGFNVLSGETGSGKSAVMEALQLALGARTDTALIRNGAEKGVVEAIFDLEELPHCRQFLEEKGLDADSNLLIIKREIGVGGKTRAFINQQSVQITVLKQLGELLLELVGQHANQGLFELAHQRHLLDLYGAHLPLRKTYSKAWQEWQRLTMELKNLEGFLPSAIRELENCEREVAEIIEAGVQEGEEEEIYQEYSLLASTEERLQAAQQLEEALRGAHNLLMKTKQSMQLLQQKDPPFAQELSPLSQVQLEVDDLIHNLQRYTSRMEVNPQRLSKLNDRLTLLNRLKRKYGQTVEEIQSYLVKQKERVKNLQNLESQMEQLKTEQQEVYKNLERLAKELTQAREIAAIELSEKINGHLAEMNMAQARSRIAIEPEEFTSFGADRVEFYLASNAGEREIPIREGTSGGELARLLLALHLLLAGKEQLGTLIFDEIDANIGGTTAAKIGHKLKELGQSLQVLSITHFPQMAEMADHHLHINKITEQGRTFSQVTKLNRASRKKELARMRGEL